MRVNGEEIQLERETALPDFLKSGGYDAARIAVERNGEIVPKSMYGECILNDADTLEIVQFVGGG